MENERFFKDVLGRRWNLNFTVEEFRQQMTTCLWNFVAAQAKQKGITEGDFRAAMSGWNELGEAFEIMSAKFGELMQNRMGSNN